MTFELGPDLIKISSSEAVFHTVKAVLLRLAEKQSFAVSVAAGGAA
jgi:hypothetical protein